MKPLVELLILLGLPILIGTSLNLQTSNFVILPFAAIIIFRIVQLYRTGEITREKDIQSSRNVFAAIRAYTFFTGIALVTIFLLKDTFVLPEWLVDNDVLTFILLHAVLQELIYRVYLINRLRNVVKSTLGISLIGAIIFAGVHLLLPFSYYVLLFTFVSGFAWTWMYQKYPSLLLVTLSHFALNAALIIWF